MKVELQCGDTITIPDGCKAIVKDGSVVFEREEKEFKDGDVLHSIYDDLMLIYKESQSSESFSSHFNMRHNYNKGWNMHSFRHASEEEKQLLFDKMKEKRLQWNAEEKRVEKIRWRAKEGEEYFMIEANIKVKAYKDDDKWEDSLLYNAFNYFRTQEQTIEAAKRVKETLRKYHEEIGE